jgi:hypothetical protein
MSFRYSDIWLMALLFFFLNPLLAEELEDTVVLEEVLSIEEVIEKFKDDDIQVRIAAANELHKRFAEVNPVIDKMFEEKITDDKDFDTRIELLNVLKRAYEYKETAEAAKTSLKKIIGQETKFSYPAKEILTRTPQILSRLVTMEFVKGRKMIYRQRRIKDIVNILIKREFVADSQIDDIPRYGHFNRHIESVFSGVELL